MEVFPPANELVRNFKKIDQFHFILQTQIKSESLTFSINMFAKIIAIYITNIRVSSIISVIQFLSLTISYIFCFIFPSLKI